MQLKRKLSGALSLASCSLLGLPSAQAESEWDVETAVMYYSENDRVSAIEPILSMRKELSDEEFLNLKFTLDSLTGASATGAVPSTQIQTFSTPSGNDTYLVAPNETPLDPTFFDTRAQFSLGWDKPIERTLRRNLGFNISKEFDFTSISGNASWTWDTNLRNTSYTLGANIEFDWIEPVGGAPLPLSSQDLTASPPILRDGDTKQKQVYDLLLGVTQIIDRTSLVQFNLSFSLADGYLNDPYKLVSRVDSTVGPNEGEPIDQIYENRPDSRQRTGLYSRYKKQLGNRDIFSISYRYMNDDWGIDSHTIDTSYRWRLDNGYYIQPGVRYYEQTAATFYRYFLLDSDTIPETVTADYRLGELTTYTFGVKFGYSDNRNNNWSIRLERYLQSGESHPDVAIGQLRGQDLYPDVEATIIQFSYSFQW
jgi:hypothetical protein